MVQPTASSGARTAPPPTPRTAAWTLPLLTGLLGFSVSWGVLRLGDDASVNLALLAGTVFVLGAVSELILAAISPNARVLHAALCAAFATLAILVPVQAGPSYAWLAGLLSGYLMIKGAADVGVALSTRVTNPIWGLPLATGIGELLLGFAASGRLLRTVYPLLLIVAGLALLRGFSDIVAAFRLREPHLAAANPQDPAHPEVSARPEASAGDLTLAKDYAAGWADFAAHRRLDAAGPGRHSAAEADEALTGHPETLSGAAMSDDLVSAGARSAGARAATRSSGERTSGERTAGERSPGAAPAGERSTGGRAVGERRAGASAVGERLTGERPVAARPGDEQAVAGGPGAAGRGPVADTGNRPAVNNAATAQPGGKRTTTTTAAVRDSSATMGASSDAAGPSTGHAGSADGADLAPRTPAASAGTPTGTPAADPPTTTGAPASGAAATGKKAANAGPTAGGRSTTGSRRRSDGPGTAARRRPDGTG